MKTYPYTAPDGIIELVRKDEHDAAVDEVYNELTEQLASFRAELTRWQSLAGTLAKSIGGLSPIYGTTPAQDEALAAYNSAKSGNLPDPLAEAVKRMEEVPCEELNKAYWNSGQVANSEWGCDRVRALLISAAKGEQP